MLDLTTELEAVNGMLDLIDEAPVTTLTDTDHLDVVRAKTALTAVLRETLAEGWRFNTDEEYVLVPTFPAPGQIVVPPDALSCDPCDPSIEASVRSGKLWDNRTNTFLWSEDVPCTIIRLFPFDTIPQVARSYIASVAQQRFLASRIASGMRTREIRSDTNMLYAKLKQEESRVRDWSMANSPAVARVLSNRRAGRTYGLGPARPWRR